MKFLVKKISPAASVKSIHWSDFSNSRGYDTLLKPMYRAQKCSTYPWCKPSWLINWSTLCTGCKTPFIIMQPANYPALGLLFPVAGIMAVTGDTGIIILPSITCIPVISSRKVYTGADLIRWQRLPVCQGTSPRTRCKWRWQEDNTQTLLYHRPRMSPTNTDIVMPVQCSLF